LVERKQLGTVQPGYVGRILATFPRARPPAPGALIEPLSDRELDVLRLMADGLKYKEIAARLFISLNTVRFHVKTIYGKLDANNRTRAVERARQLHIL
jgi:LuxR family maltose regulon positive regulatory protein